MNKIRESGFDYLVQTVISLFDIWEAQNETPAFISITMILYYIQSPTIAYVQS